MDNSGHDFIDVGSVLRDTYEITGVLGKGGMGTVYLAQHKRLPGKQVAIKVLQVGLASPELFQRFRREADIVSRLGHPNIVEVLDFNTLEHGTPYLVLEFLRGESLAKRLKSGPIDLDTTFSVVRQVGSGLLAAHKAGIVHRDLKPDNVFLVPTDSGGVVSHRVKLLDFGISKMADPDSSLKTRDAVLIGTPQYMAPEQALGKNSEIDVRTDVFALGCIVYEMLSGRGPFAGTLIAEVVYRVVHEEPERLANLCPDLSATVVQAVEKAMKKAPADRYATVGDFVTELTGTPLKTLSNPSLPVAPAPAEHISSGISLDVTMRPSKIPTAEERPKATPPVAPVPPPAGPALPLGVRPPRGPRFWLAVTIGVGATVGVAGALGYRLWATPPPAPPPVLPEVATPHPPPPPPPPLTVVETHPTPPKVEPHTAPERLPPEVQADLTAAEQALKDGNADEAIRLARHSQRLLVTGPSYSVLVRAHCEQKDLSNARAQWSNVPASSRRSVQQFCKTHGIDL